MLDTNVFLSGIFFGGIPGRLLEAWQAGHFTLVLSPAILAEYHRAGEALAARYPDIDAARSLPNQRHWWTHPICRTLSPPTRMTTSSWPVRSPRTRP